MNFDDSRQNNNVFKQKKTSILKIAGEIKVNVLLIYREKSQTLPILDKIACIYTKNHQF